MQCREQRRAAKDHSRFLFLTIFLLTAVKSPEWSRKIDANRENGYL